MIDLEHPEILTKEEILSEEIIDLIFDEQDLVKRRMLINAVEERATEKKCKTGFTELIKARNQMIRNEKKEQNESKKNYAQQNGLSAVEFHGEVVTPNVGRFVLNNDGIFTTGKNGLTTVCYSPVIIGKRYSNILTGEERVELIWKIGNVERSMMVPKVVIASKNNIVKLSANGFPVTSGNAAEMVEYLYVYENLNPSPIHISSGKFGWTPDYQKFVPYASDVDFETGSGFDDLYRSIDTHGSGDVWMNAVKQIRKSGRFEPMIFMAASFASPLVRISGSLPFVVNLYGESGSGKTVTSMLAASIWANPGGNGFLVEGNSTMVAFEQRLGCLNDLPMFVDDLSKVKNRDQDALQKFIYTVSSGQGKGRGKAEGGVRETGTWRNTILTNIERPILDDTAQGGAVNRVLEFEADDGDIFQSGHDTAETLRENYGFAGELFVTIVRKMGPEAIQKKVKEYQDKIIEADPKKAVKQVIPMAVILTADEIASDFIFQDDIRLDFNRCIKQLKCKDEVSEMMRAYRNLMDFVMQKYNSFMPVLMPDGTHQYKSEVYGCFLNDDPKSDQVAILPGVYRKIANECNFSAAQFADWASHHGIISKPKEKSGYPRIWFQSLGRQRRCIVFYTNISQIGDESQTVPTENDLPDDLEEVTDMSQIPF